MIEVIYNRSKLSVSIKGHAGSAEKGKDLVCAAVSILAGTLAADVVSLCADHKRARSPKVKLDEGDALISCRAVHGMGNVALLIFDSVCSGFDILAQKYPQFVSYTVKG